MNAEKAKCVSASNLSALLSSSPIFHISELRFFHHDFVLCLHAYSLKNLLLLAALEHLDFSLLAPGLALPQGRVSPPLPISILHPGTRIGQIFSRESSFSLQHISLLGFVLQKVIKQGD